MTYKSRKETIEKMEELFNQIGSMWKSDITHDDVKELSDEVRESVLYWLGKQ